MVTGRPEPGGPLAGLGPGSVVAGYVLEELIGTGGSTADRPGAVRGSRPW